MNSEKPGAEGSESEVPRAVTVRVGREILEGRFEAGAWAQALASVKGSREQSVAEYARLRIAQLTAQRSQVREKLATHEFRRLHSCLGVSSVKEILKRMNQGGKINIPRPRMPVVWLLVLMIGCAGSVAGLMRLGSDWLPQGIQPWVPLVALGGGFGLVAGMVLLSLSLPTSLLHRIWGEGVVIACSAACLASLYLGAKVLERNPHEGVQRGATARVAPAFGNVGSESAALEALDDDVVVPAAPVLVRGMNDF